MQNKQVWIGLVTVIPTPQNVAYGKYRGACANVLALADSKESFIGQVHRVLNDQYFEVQEIEDSELFSHRLANYSVDESICALAEEVATLGGVRFGTFHTFRYDDS